MFASLSRMTWGFAVVVTASLLTDSNSLRADEMAETADNVPAAVVPDLTGHWSGNWYSTYNGHNGPMNATFCRLDDCHYEVTFKGRFCRFIPFRYRTVLTVTGYDEEGRVLLSGSERLGPIYGTFSFSAAASDSQFVANFWARKDHGQFVLSRCCP